MLYDLEKDPHENQNIADVPEQKETVLKMNALLKQRMQEAPKYKKPSSKKCADENLTQTINADSRRSRFNIIDRLTCGG